MRSFTAALLSCAVTVAGCARGCGSPPLDLPRDFGDTTAPAPDALSYLVMARAIVEHRGRRAVPEPPRAAGRRVFLVAWRAPSEPLFASASGATLADGVASAADVLAAQMQDARGMRLEIDFAVSAEGAALESESTAMVSIGQSGVLAAGESGKAAFVLPGEIVQRGLFRRPQGSQQSALDAEKLEALLADRAAVSKEDLKRMRLYRFRADAYVESSDHERALAVYRGMVQRPAHVTAALLFDGVRRGADYLARVLSDEGRYVYMYHPAEDRDDAGYGWLRHAGTTYALLEAYEQFAVPLYLEKSERALAYLKRRMRNDPESQGKYVLDTLDEEQQKVGGAGLALLAFAEHAAATGKRDNIDTMRALARFIAAQQFADGHLRSNADLPEESGKKRKREPIYYPGEAILALMRLYAIDPQSAYLETARRAADWIVHTRDANTTEDTQEHDHWMAYACNDLYRATSDPAYVSHAQKIARAILKKQKNSANAPAPDWIGAFYQGESTLAATRLEAYDSVIRLTRFTGLPDSGLLGAAQDAGTFLVGQQFGTENAYWLRNPSKVAGGVRESLFVSDVRIDYVQHAMSAWLHLARILDDPAYGAPRP
jgi:Beta-L-arabinofuranosidase, GH127 catalytic domain